MNVEKLLNPVKIVLVGANERDGFGGDTARNLLRFGKKENIYFVNPKRTEVFGHKCYPSITDLPEEIDQILIATPKFTVNDLLREGVSKGATSAIVFASGYSETGKEEDLIAEQELIKVADELGIAVMGPNCAGFLNLIDGVPSYALGIPEDDRRGSVALISQSGQTCLSAMESQNMKMSYNISAGNSAVIKMEDYLEYLVEDSKTKVIAMHLEGVQKPEKLIRSFKKAAEIGKPIVILKIGSSVKGSISAASHTGSLSGTDKVISSVFKKFGVIRVDDLQELFSVSMTLATLETLPKKSSFGLIAISGGEVGISADMCEKYGIDLPDFSKEATKKLNDILPGYATANNPLDATATLAYDTEAYAAAVKTILEEDSIGGLILGFTLAEEVIDPAIRYITPAIKNALAEVKVKKPVVMMPYMENTRNPEYRDELLEMGVPILPPPKYALPTLRKILDFTEYDYEKHTLEVALPSNSEGESVRSLNEIESMEMLKKYGIRTPISQLATSEDDVKQIMSKIDGKVVLKIASEDIQHKTDVGGVKLNIDSVNEAQRSFNEILSTVKKNKPHAKLDGVTVQEMVEKGMEIIIGVTNDIQFGPSVMVGLGGVFVEIFKDTALYPAPINKNEALEMIKSLQAWPLFDGYRGQKLLDVEALAEIIVSVGELASDNKDNLSELDINPLFLYEEGKGVCAADALVVLKK